MKENKEREALEMIREIFRRENLTGVTVRIAHYLEAIKEMKSAVEEAPRDEARQDAALMAIEHFAVYGRELAADVNTVINAIQDETGEALRTPEAEQGHMPTEEELRDLYRDKHTNVSEHEEKQKILDVLLPAVQATRAGAEVKSLIIGNLHKSVDIYFQTGAVKSVNVEADSGIAMIVDVCRALM